MESQLLNSTTNNKFHQNTAMDAYQQHHRYTRAPAPPPPPPLSDPYHHQQQPPPPPLPRPPVPPQGGHWYSNQFQYSPSPPPPPSQWAPPPPPHPHPDHFPPPGSYPPPQHHYPPVHQNHFPSAAPPQRPPRSPLPPHFPPHAPQSYAPEWGAPTWSHHQAHNTEEDWAARARAWADAKAAMENQHPQSQFVPAGRVDEQSHYHDQYLHPSDAHYTEIQHQSLPASSCQQVPVPAAPLHWPLATHPSEVPSGSDASYGAEGHLHTVRDGMSTADSNAMIQSQGNLPKNPSVHQQEVPSSYSSVTGNDGGANQIEHSYRLLSQEGQCHVQPPPAIPLADQPLELAPRFNHDDPHIQSGYPYFDSAGPIRGMDTVATMPSRNSWTAPVTLGVSYPPIPPAIPSGPQHDHALVVPSVPGHAAPPYSSFPGSGLQPTIGSAGPPCALSAGTSLHPTTAFSGDAFGIPSVSERPKKAPVPNWLKEEIKKAVITSSSLDHPKEETQSIEDEDGDKSFGKGDQEDSKSIDSSRSAEEDDDDEDYVEAARTAAINQEIKRVLTEVLLKVTDELFDEIATKVLNEDDLTVEVDKSRVTSNHRDSLSPPTLPTPKATAKILIPGKSKVSEIKEITGNSSSSSPGDVLGLANYATDDENGDESESSGSPKSRKKDVLQLENPSEDRHDVDASGSSLLQPEELNRNQTNLESEPSKASLIESRYTNTDAVTDFQKIRKNESDVGGSASGGRSKDIASMARSELLENEDLKMKRSKDNNQVKETKIRLDKNDRRESKRSSEKDFQKGEDSGKTITDEKGNGNHRVHDERHSRKEKTEELNGSKDRRKEQSPNILEKVQESESKKRSSHALVKEGRKETEAPRRAGTKEESNRKREHNKDKDDERSRPKHGSDSSRHKRRRSSSISRGRNSKDDSVHRYDESSDEASNDSKRKLCSRRRNSPSPSPVKSRRRQVSRSPHSKHSQRRHAPYSSHDSKRGRRSQSRSRTPVRRHR